MKKYVYKVPGGKLLKMNLEIGEDGVISEVNLAGDFFMYPEEGVVRIEEFLRDRNVNEDFVPEMDEFLKANQIEVFGFKPQDLWDCIVANS